LHRDLFASTALPEQSPQIDSGPGITGEPRMEHVDDTMDCKNRGNTYQPSMRKRINKHGMGKR
jgi:hypothetical protein